VTTLRLNVRRDITGILGIDKESAHSERNKLEKRVRCRCCLSNKDKKTQDSVHCGYGPCTTCIEYLCVDWGKRTRKKDNILHFSLKIILLFTIPTIFLYFE